MIRTRTSTEPHSGQVEEATNSAIAQAIIATAQAIIATAQAELATTAAESAEGAAAGALNAVGNVMVLVSQTDISATLSAGSNITVADGTGPYPSAVLTLPV
jgi:hypothetical protein